jgi:SNF2 family DNA or RNA helicase
MLENSIKKLLSLSPTGHLQIISIVEHEEQAIKIAIVNDNKIIDAFHVNQEAGLLALVAAKDITNWPKALIYWRTFISYYITDLCHLSPESSLQLGVINLPKQEVLEQFINEIPPMPGAEYCNKEVLQFIWQSFDNWIYNKMQEQIINIGEFLTKYLPHWRQVGRVCFHLAENKQDPDYPFAFLATYAKKLMNNSRIQYQPLNKALQEYAGESNKKALANLLQPIDLAAQKCKWVQELVSSKDIYHGLAWQPQEAYKLLRDSSLLEEAGIVIKCPDWWKSRPKSRVQVTIGNVNDKLFNIKELLNVNISVALGDEALTEQELEELLSHDGLIFMKGQWVEINQEQLKETLAHWKSIQKQVANGGMTFIEGMRLLAGVGNNLDVENIDHKQNNLVWIKASGKLKEIIARLKNPESIKLYAPGEALHAKLRPYQTTGVNWLCFLTELGLGACLADDMGLGKTIQIIALLLIQKQQQKNIMPSLLVVPASLLANWQSEINRFAPSLKILCLHASETSNNDFSKQAFDVIITTYGMLLRQTWLEEQNWTLIILDEAQAIKNPSAKQTKAVKKLSGKAKIALTGTPVENRLGDLWSLFDFICPGLLGSSTKFKNFIKTLNKQDNLTFAPLRKLIQPYILRRLKTDKKIMHDLPDKTEVVAWCNLTKDQAKLYMQAVKELSQALQNIDSKIKRRGLVLAYLTKFKQICNHPSQFLGDHEYIDQKSGKFLRLKEICDEICSRQEKVLIFTQYSEIIPPLAIFLKEIFGQPGLMLHGGTPIKQRKNIVEQFQQEQANPFFILSLKAGGVGLNLTAARHVIHFDRWWNPAVENQATDRAYRIGQNKNVLVHKFICSGTMEEKIDHMINSKTRLSNDILNGDHEILLTELNDQEIIDLVSLNIDSCI